MVFNEIAAGERTSGFITDSDTANMKEEKVEGGGGGGGGVCAVCGDKATGIHYRVLSCEVRGRGMSSSLHDYLHQLKSTLINYNYIDCTH